MAVHNIVIVGANFGGISIAHYLLRHIIPSLESKNKSKTYKITLISPSSHLFFKIAAPRAVVSPDLVPLSKIFLAIEDGFKEYSPDRFSFVQGLATALDERQKTLTIETLTPQSSTSVSYDSLVIATGTTSTSVLWNLNGSHKKSIKEFEELHQSLPKASSILIAGGGPAGTETAGEIGTLFPKPEKTILSGAAHLLPRLRPAIGADAESKLANLGVKTINNVKVRSASRTSSGKTTLELSDNTTKTVDVYIDATGGKPNSSFLPSTWLNERGYVETDSNTMRVTPTTGVYAIGDVASYSNGALLDVMEAVRPLCRSLLIDQSDAKSGEPAPKQIPYASKTLKETQLVPIGPKGGVGAVFGWRVPSLMVKLVKGKTYMVEKAPGAVTGKDYLKA